VTDAAEQSPVQGREHKTVCLAAALSRIELAG
jgi:hypothetical protein